MSNPTSKRARKVSMKLPILTKAPDVPIPPSLVSSPYLLQDNIIQRYFPPRMPLSDLDEIWLGDTVPMRLGAPSIKNIPQHASGKLVSRSPVRSASRSRKVATSLLSPPLTQPSISFGSRKHQPSHYFVPADLHYQTTTPQFTPPPLEASSWHEPKPAFSA